MSLAGVRRPLVLGVCAVAGLALRVWTHRSLLGTPDSDEAIVGLMAQHALHGHFTVFYWGQPYGGTQEALLVAPLFAIFGKSLIVLRLVPAVLSAVAAWVLWRVGRRTIGEPAALFAAALFWIWPPFNLVWLSHEYDFYGTNLLYCALLLLLALRVVELPSHARMAMLGLVVGLAVWQTIQLTPVLVPLIAWTAWKQPACLRRVPTAAAAALLGGAPWLIWNMQHDWGSVMHRAGLGEYAHSLRLFASPLMPMMLGLRAAFTAEPVVPLPLMLAVSAGLLVLFLIGLRRTRGRAISIAFVVAACFPFVWALSRRVTYQSSDPQYLIVLTPVLTLLVAQVATNYRRGIALLAVGFAVSVISLQSMDGWRHADRVHWPPNVPRSFAPLIAALEEDHVTRVYADYWIAYRLDFDSDERIVATENDFGPAPFVAGEVTPAPYPYVRYRAYEDVVRAARHGFVFFARTTATLPIVKQLEQHHYRLRRVGPFAVYVPPPGRQRQLSPAKAKVTPSPS